MIPVELQPEPIDFDANVRKPGKAFLAKTPSPKRKDFKENSHWRKSANNLYTAYSGICAYSCFYMPSFSTIDHFLPKSTYPEYAYEWHNFRLCSQRLNNYKDDSTDVLDPFSIQLGWFVLDFPSCLVRSGQGLPDDLRQKVETTINRLHLNLDDDLVQERCDIMVYYASGEVNLAFMTRRYPFLAKEIVRQSLQKTAASIFKMRTQ